MVARCLHELGVYMGDVRNATYEDPAFSTLIERLRTVDGASDEASSTWAELRALIQQRNAEQDVWGWKIPGLFVPRLLSELRNPCVIVAHRDLVAVSARIAASENSSFEATYRHFSQLQQQIHDQAIGLECPRLLVSYEKALSNKDAFVDVLGRFIGIDAGATRIRHARASITPSPARYLADTAATEVHGNLDGVFDGEIMGWAARPNAPGATVTVHIDIDDRYDFSVMTDVERPDVARHLEALRGEPLPEGHGRYGFALAIPSELRDGEAHKVTVRVVDTEDYRIGYSPQRLVFPSWLS